MPAAHTSCDTGQKGEEVGKAISCDISCISAKPTTSISLSAQRTLEHCIERAPCPWEKSCVLEDCQMPYTPWTRGRLSPRQRIEARNTGRSAHNPCGAEGQQN